VADRAEVFSDACLRFGIATFCNCLVIGDEPPTFESERIPGVENSTVAELTGLLCGILRSPQNVPTVIAYTDLDGIPEIMEEGASVRRGSTIYEVVEHLRTAVFLRRAQGQEVLFQRVDRTKRFYRSCHNRAGQMARSLCRGTPTRTAKINAIVRREEVRRVTLSKIISSDALMDREAYRRPSVTREIINKGRTEFFLTTIPAAVQLKPEASKPSEEVMAESQLRVSRDGLMVDQLASTAKGKRLGEDMRRHATLLATALHALGYRGHFGFAPESQITWRGEQVLAAVRLSSDMRGIRLKVKPGDNGTAWTVDLYEQGAATHDLPTLLRRLKSLDAWRGDERQLLRLVQDEQHIESMRLGGKAKPVNVFQPELADRPWAANGSATAVEAAPVAVTAPNPLPQPAPVAATSDAGLSVLEKIQSLQAAAKRHQDERQRASALRAEAELLLKQADDLERQAKELEAALDSDPTGRQAADTLAALAGLLKG
jgi:hypothetical protein